MIPDEFLDGPGIRGLVSVVIATYNRAGLISQALESVLEQTCPLLEAIVVDDGSTDDTEAVVAGFSDDRVRYFRKPNGGLSSARNFGLDVARGEFIAFLDSDDIWMPWKLAAQLELFRRYPDVGLVWSDFSNFRDGNLVVSERGLRDYYTVYRRVDFDRICPVSGKLAELGPEVPAEWKHAPYRIGSIFPEMFLGNFVHPPTAIVRRSWVRRSGPYEPLVTGRGADDYHFFYRLAREGRVAMLDAPTILYRLHPSQISTAHALEEARADLRVVTHWLVHSPPDLSRKVIRKRRAGALAWVGYEELQAGNSGVARGHLLNSFWLDPVNPGTLKWLTISLLPRALTDLLRGIKRALYR